MANIRVLRSTGGNYFFLYQVNSDIPIQIANFRLIRQTDHRARTADTHAFDFVSFLQNALRQR